MFDTLELAPVNELVTADQTKDLEGITRNLSFTDALRVAAQCKDLQQAFGSWGDGQETACALSAVVAVSRRTGWLV